VTRGKQQLGRLVGAIRKLPFVAPLLLARAGSLPSTTC